MLYRWLMRLGKPQAVTLDGHGTVAGIDAAPSRLPPRWSRRSRLELGALPSAVPCARLHAKVILQEWNLAQLAETAELIVSELTTNALKASSSLTETQPIALDLLASHDWLIVQVWDAVLAAPDLRPHAPDAEAGRGLEIVSLLSDRWGFYRPRSGGKTVWAAIGVNRAHQSAG